MSTVVIATQVREVIRLANGSLKYLVSTYIKDKGDLPFAEIFVVKITDPLDVKRDVLVRIATPFEFRQADLTAARYVKAVSPNDILTLGPDTFVRLANVNDVTALTRERVTAVRQGQTTYLSAQITALYDNVETAIAAATTFRARASDLVVAWRAAQTTFITLPTQDYELPVLNGSIEAALTASFVSKKAARVLAEKDRDAAKLAKDACERDCAADKAIYNFLILDVSFLEKAKLRVQALGEGVAVPSLLVGGTPAPGAGTYTISAPVVTTNVRTFALNAGDAESYEALLTKKRSDLAVYAAKARTCAETCAALGAALLAAQATVDAARNGETAALATLTAVCPTFSPSSV